MLYYFQTISIFALQLLKIFLQDLPSWLSNLIKF